VLGRLERLDAAAIVLAERRPPAHHVQRRALLRGRLGQDQRPRTRLRQGAAGAGDRSTVSNNVRPIEGDIRYG